MTAAIRLVSFRPLLLLSGYLGRSLTQVVLLWACASQAGASGAGQFATVLALTTPIFAVAELALRNVYQTQVDAPSFRIFFLIRAFFAVSAAALIVLVAVSLREFGSFALLAPVLAMKVADSAIDICVAALQVERRYFAAAAWMWVNTAGTIVVLTLGVTSGLDPEGLVWASAAVSWAVLAIFAPLLLTARGPWIPSRAQLASVLRAGIALGAAQGVSSLSFYLPTLFLTVAATSSDVGVFAVGQYAVIAGSLVLSSLMQTWLSPLRHATDHGDADYRHVRRAATVMVIIGLLGATVTTGFLPAVTAGFFGPEFELSWWEAVAFGIAVAALGLDYAATTALLVLNRYGRRTFGVLCGLMTGAFSALVLVDDASVLTAAWVLALSLTGSAAFTVPFRTKDGALGQR